VRCKKTVDARSYSHEMLERLRRDAVKRVEDGESPEAVVAGLGLNRRTIYRPDQQDASATPEVAHAMSQAPETMVRPELEVIHGAEHRAVPARPVDAGVLR
jgi:hypothetical protein